MLKASLVVCTYNRAELLDECLRSLDAFRDRPADLELIVVDNNSSDQTKEVCEAYLKVAPNFRYLMEPEQGLSYARNCGFRNSNALWIAYIDDDSKVYPDYVERLLYVITNYDFDCIGGMYYPWYKYGKPKWFRDEYASQILFRDTIGVLEKGYASGGAIVFKRTTLERYAGFPIQIGMSGGQLAYGEEILPQRRIRSDGGRIGFDPDLRVLHLVDKRKLKVTWHLRSAYAKGRDHWISFDLTVTWLAILKTITNGSLEFLVHLVSSTPKLVLKDYYRQNWVMDVIRPLVQAWSQTLSALRQKFSD